MGKNKPAVAEAAPAAAAVPQGGGLRHLRWYVCGLLFLATTVNYIDRQSVGVLNKEILQPAIGWDEAGFGWVMFAFQTAYALMFPISGRMLDRFGVRAGMAWAVVVWSIAAMAHAFARTTLGFAAARFALGLGEAANFPASIKAVAEWFPRRERAFATGIFNSGTNVGVMLSPAIVWLALHFSWQMAFLVTGVLGFLWLGVWLWLYRAPERHPLLTSEERGLILSDKEPPSAAVAVPWTSLLRYRQAWAFLLGKMLTDPVWWFYLYWLPPYLNKERGVSALTAAAMLFWPYLAADVGSIGGGWLSGFLMKRGVQPGPARLATLLIFALCMPGAIWAVLTDRFWVALSLISLATASHQAWSANVFTLASDMFPKKVVGSVVGLGGMCGAIGGMFMTLIAGGMLQWLGSYKPLFILAGVMHPIAFLLILGFAGRNLEKADVDAGLKTGTSPTLLGVGAVVTAIGAALSLTVWSNWAAVVRAAKLSAAAGGLVASIGVALLGLALLYAGKGRQRPVGA